MQWATPFAMVLGAAVALYWPVGAKLAHDWSSNSDYWHAFVVLPVALWLVWKRRAVLAATPRTPRNVGLVLVGVACLLLVIGTLGAELFVTRISLLLVVAGTALYLCGSSALRLISFPLALVALAIPLPAIVVERLTLSLQLIASTLAEGALGVARIPVLREGNVLVLPNATIQVAEACSGIRSLAALVTLALVMAHVADKGWGPRLTILGLAVPIAILVNGLRVAATALGTYHFGLILAQGKAHELLGGVMFLAALGLLAASERAVSRIVARWSPVAIAAS